MTLTYQSAFRSDVGKSRELNEDACFVGTHIFAVADGLGGHQAGEVASNLALEQIASLEEMDARKAAEQVGAAVRRSNRAVFELQQKNAELQGMGTTLTVVALYDGTAHLAHVGDSRAYLIRGASMSQLSNDHTLVARMVQEGKLTQEQAESHPQRSILTRALGADRDVDVDEVKVDLLPGDRLLLCSDGLTTVLSDEEIRTLALQGDDLEEVCTALIDEANARGGPDNITTVLVAVGGSAPPRAARALPGERGTGSGRPSGRRFPVRALVWTLIVLTFVVGGWFGVKAWAGRSYYVGIAADRVAIYRGLPVEVGSLSLSKVEEPTDLAVADVADWLHPKLEEGIRAATLTDARRVVEQQIRPYAKKPAASPSGGSARPTPTAEATP